MKNSVLAIFSLAMLIISCTPQEARRPISYSKSHTLANVSGNMKKINKIEEEKIHAYLQKDSLLSYRSSSDGYWYATIEKVKENTPYPKEGDLVELQYEILDLSDQVIYSSQELGTKVYKVNKENFIPALQLGIKSIKVGETVKFVIPPYRAFGVVGDQHKIGINQSIISIVTLLNIKLTDESN